MDEPDWYSVEVVYASPDRFFVESVKLKAGSTVADAIGQSGLLERCPAIAAAPLVAGIYGLRVSLSTEPHDGDRIEIYRPLVADPKQQRLKRARGKAKTAP